MGTVPTQGQPLDEEQTSGVKGVPGLAEKTSIGQAFAVDGVTSPEVIDTGTLVDEGLSTERVEFLLHDGTKVGVSTWFTKKLRAEWRRNGEEAEQWAMDAKAQGLFDRSNVDGYYGYLHGVYGKHTDTIAIMSLKPKKKRIAAKTSPGSPQQPQPHFQP